jgi:WD40 repeat protein
MIRGHPKGNVAVIRSRNQVFAVRREGQCVNIPIALALSNDAAEIIASTADGNVHFSSTSDLKIKKTINGERKVSAAAFSPDNSTYALATHGNYEIELFKSADHSSLVSSYWTHNGDINALAFSPDGKYLVSGSNDGNVTFWMPSDHSFKLVTFTHYQGVTAMAFTKTGLATIGADNCLKTWELGAPEPAPAY